MKSTGMKASELAQIDVEGYSAADPVEDEYWVETVRRELNGRWYENRLGHDRNAYFCEPANSDACKALGHVVPKEGDDEHPFGWDGDVICPATRYGSACSECESENCPWSPTDRDAFWALFRDDKEGHHD
jgi:hypothetical protein